MGKGRISIHYERALQTHLPAIKRDLRVEDIMDDLISRDVFKILEGQDINRDSYGHSQKINTLVERLLFVGDYRFGLFIDCLRPHYNHLAELLCRPNDIQSTQEGRPTGQSQTDASETDTGQQYQPFDYQNVTDGPTGKTVALTHPIRIEENRHGGSDITDQVARHEYETYNRLLKDERGWTSHTSSRYIMDAVRKNQNIAGGYIVWYSRRKSFLTVTVIYPEEKGGCLHFKVKIDQQDGKTMYRVRSDFRSESIHELLEHIRQNGFSLNR